VENEELEVLKEILDEVRALRSQVKESTRQICDAIKFYSV
jgi:hypothetical protein